MWLSDLWLSFIWSGHTHRDLFESSFLSNQSRSSERHFWTSWPEDRAWKCKRPRDQNQRTNELRFHFFDMFFNFSWIPAQSQQGYSGHSSPSPVHEGDGTFPGGAQPGALHLPGGRGWWCSSHNLSRWKAGFFFNFLNLNRSSTVLEADHCLTEMFQFLLALLPRHHFWFALRTLTRSSCTSPVPSPQQVICLPSQLNTSVSSHHLMLQISSHFFFL